MISSVLVSITVDIRHFLSFNNILTTKLSLDGAKIHQTDSRWARFKKKCVKRLRCDIGVVLTVFISVLLL